MKHQKSNKTVYKVLAVIFGLIFLVCVIWLISYFIGLKQAQKELDDIYENFVSASESIASSETDSAASTEASSSTETEPASSETGSEESTESAEPSEEDNPLYTGDLSEYGVDGRTIDFAALQSEKNEHIYAWIVVPGTVIDYPVLQHPEEMDYYLDHNLNHSKGYPGCIYTQRMNSKDWTDPNTVLYGHNMKNGTMFAALHRYKAADFFDENRYIHIYTEDGRILIYDIFAAYEYSDAHLLMSFQLYTDAGIQAYFDSIFENDGINSNFREGVDLTADSKVITLSTCISNKPTSRYLVQGVLVAEGEQQ